MKPDWRTVNVPEREIDAIIRRVAEAHDISISDMMGLSHEPHFAWPRQQAMWEALQTGKYSTTQVGLRFKRHHTTIIHGARRHAERLAQIVHSASTENATDPATHSREQRAKQSTVSA